MMQVKTLNYIVLVMSLLLASCSVVVKDSMVVSPSKQIDDNNLKQLTEVHGYSPQWLVTATGKKVYALSRKVEGQTTTLLVLHGNALNMSLQPWFGVLESLAATNFNILAIDYQGYGFSDGEASFSNMLSDTQLAITALSKNEEIYVYGLSLGSVMATSIAKDDRVAGLIIEGGITDVAEMVVLYRSRNLFGGLVNIELDNKLKFDNISMIKGISKPVLVIHGEKDSNIPFSMGKALYLASSNTLSSFYPVAEGGHCDTFIKDEKSYLPRIKQFIESVSVEEKYTNFTEDRDVKPLQE
ncbi:alpha/beta hydrolase [Shewanella sp. 1180_01]|uniref:alpha/beta hydrolase n=1 Tax=Shewanella sp. 1180_01 TaxID=2604451 RepID=UPI004062D3EC